MPGVLLLCLLFFYDIFWVFYSPKFTGGQSVMVKVATGFDVPIKLLMPHITERDYPTTNCSLLGLGDIVVPGMYIGFLIRFGKYISLEGQNTSAYRNAALFSYSLALLTCGFCLWIYHQAQPALLYIVPGLLLATFSVGLFRGEISRLRQGIDVEVELKGLGKTRKDHIKRIEYELTSADEERQVIKRRHDNDKLLEYEI